MDYDYTKHGYLRKRVFLREKYNFRSSFPEPNADDDKEFDFSYKKPSLKERKSFEVVTNLSRNEDFESSFENDENNDTIQAEINAFNSSSISVISSVPKPYFFSASQEAISKPETENKDKDKDKDTTASPEISIHIDSENAVTPNAKKKKGSTESKNKILKIKIKPNKKEKKIVTKKTSAVTSVVTVV